MSLAFCARAASNSYSLGRFRNGLSVGWWGIVGVTVGFLEYIDVYSWYLIYTKGVFFQQTQKTKWEMAWEKHLGNTSRSSESAGNFMGITGLLSDCEWLGSCWDLDLVSDADLIGFG